MSRQDIRDMRPPLALPNLVDVDSAYAVANLDLGHRNSIGKIGADIENVVNRQSRLGMSRAQRHTSLRGRVGRVVCWRAEKQVGRIAARWIVAAVAHEHPRRDWSVSQLPGRSMRAGLTFRPSPTPELSVSCREALASPQPAAGFSGGGINLRPKSLRDRTAFHDSGGVATKILQRAPLDLAAFGKRSGCRGAQLAATATTKAVAVGPFKGNVGGDGTIGVKHRNLFSGGPVGVTSTATGISVALNYSTSVLADLPATYWPGNSHAKVQAGYVDPAAIIGRTL